MCCPSTHICCCLDYCNYKLYGMSDGLLRKVQSIQNAAARLVTGARRCDQRPYHAGAALAACPSTSRVQGCMPGTTPVSGWSDTSYIADDIQLIMDSDYRQLRSAAAKTCLVPRTHNNFGNRSFNAVGPCVWNSLLPHLQ